MQINIVWILLTVVFSYLLIGNILYASVAGVVFMVLWGFVHLSSAAYNSYKKHKQKKRKTPWIRFGKKYMEQYIILFLLLCISLLVAMNYSAYLKSALANVHMMHVYKNMPDETLINAMDDLKKNPNKIELCTLLMLPSLDDNNPEVIAKYLAFYHLEGTYCNKWWQWGRQDCNYLRLYGGHPVELQKNIKLCEVAQSRSFLIRIKTKVN